ncbi:MAG: chitinase [Lachnospiraceae bacterium]|nr:chitinase [Lachnospiraceae bacterium]MBR3508644.1 chitinase [Lachnospiraceae bacterium]MBR4606012.1 chitinase [Lachnospiraceae bacterium]MBR6150618.1 chitinase [Lachnospiraceae bacterium]
MKRKIIPVLIALILIVLVVGVAISMRQKEKVSYGTDVMDLRTYFDVEEGKLAIYLQEERVAEKALLIDGTCYLNLTFVKSYLNDQFFYDWTEKKLIYTDALGSFVATPGEDGYLQYGEKKNAGYKACILEGESPFLALPFVGMLSSLEYYVNDYRLLIKTSWEPYESAQVTADTKIRYQGDVKSEILCDAKVGESLEIMENLPTWSRVRNDEGIIGYVENTCLGASWTVTPERKPVKSDYEAPEYTSDRLYEKVCLGWHAIGGVGGNSTLEEMVANTEGMNVISPTWFSLSDNEGGFRSFGEASYVTRAHKYGYEVWPAWDDFNYRLETGENIDDTAIFSSSEKRGKLISNMINTSKSLGVDGINLDFEKIGAECSEYYGQFLRELSAECRKNALTLSVDNYMPNEGNKQYRYDVQGQVVDYVILMGYDEHWHGSKNPGSVASIGFITDGITKTLENVPAEKLINAVPFYTILWKLDGTEVTDEYLTLVNQADFIKRMKVTPVWDEGTCQNYAEWSSNGKTYKVWLEDLDSISMKLNVMSAKGLAGVAAWRLGYGTQEIWTLLSAFKQM